MRTLVTVTRLSDIKIHAFRDRTGAMHVTGMTIHGALVIPTRAFWISLAQLNTARDGDFEAEFGNEYRAYEKCVADIGDRELYFSIAVDEDNVALLDGVSPSHEQVDYQQSMIRSLFAARRGAFRDWDDDSTFARDDVLRFRSQFFASEDDCKQRFDVAGDSEISGDFVGSDFAESDFAESDFEDLEDGRDLDDGCDHDQIDWPLLSAPLETSRDLWGWDSFHRLPASEEALWMLSPVGTVKPSVN